jgi:RHS repeat-associated protein
MFSRTLQNTSISEPFTGFVLHSFNGKEKDDEWNSTTGGFQDYGMRMYDTRIAKFLSVDPLAKKYPMLTTFQFASNTPIWGIDLDGLEVYYNTSGNKWSDADVKTYTGKTPDPTNKEVVLMTVKKWQIKILNKWQDIGQYDVHTYNTKLKEDQILDRATWAYGETGGALLRQYAHVINNISKNYSTEKAMYLATMSNWVDYNKDNIYDPKTETVSLYPDYLQGKGTLGANAFYTARTNSSYTPLMKKAIAEVIMARVSYTTDPTNGANQWRGGSVAKNINKSSLYQNKTYCPTDAAGNIVKEQNATFFTIFFKM